MASSLGPASPRAREAGEAGKEGEEKEERARVLIQSKRGRRGGHESKCTVYVCTVYVCTV